MLKQIINLSVIGFVDHGKSTFVSTLTNYNTDTHSLEQKKRITIKLGYADFEDVNRHYYILDTPGHQILLTKMLTSLSISDIPIVVVSGSDLDEPLELCENYLRLVAALNFPLVVVAISKLDTISYDKAKEKIERIKAICLKYLTEQKLRILPFSFYSQKYKGLLLEYLNEFKRTNKLANVGHIFRSFDVNLPGANIKELKGGVVGGILNLPLTVNQEIRICNYDKQYVTKIEDIIQHGQSCEQVVNNGFYTLLTSLDPSLCAADKLANSVIVNNSSLLKELTINLQNEFIPVIDKKAEYCLVIKHIPVLCTLKQQDKKAYRFTLSKPIEKEICKDTAILTVKTTQGWKVKGVGSVVS